MKRKATKASATTTRPLPAKRRRSRQEPLRAFTTRCNISVEITPGVWNECIASGASLTAQRLEADEAARLNELLTELPRALAVLMRSKSIRFTATNSSDNPVTVMLVSDGDDTAFPVVKMMLPAERVGTVKNRGTRTQRSPITT